MFKHLFVLNACNKHDIKNFYLRNMEVYVLNKNKSFVFCFVYLYKIFKAIQTNCVPDKMSNVTTKLHKHELIVTLLFPI